MIWYWYIGLNRSIFRWIILLFFYFAFEIMAIRGFKFVSLMLPLLDSSVLEVSLTMVYWWQTLFFFHIYLFKKLTMKILLLGHYFLNYYMPWVWTIIKLMRTDTTLDFRQKTEKYYGKFLIYFFGWKFILHFLF